MCMASYCCCVTASFCSRAAKRSSSRRAIKLRPGLLDAGPGDIDVRGGGGNAGIGGRTSGFRLGKGCAGLGKGEAEFGVFDDDERVALLHLLIFLEADFADVARNAGVDGGDVLLDAGIVGELYIAEVHELVDDDDDARDNQYGDDDVVSDSYGLVVVHFLWGMFGNEGS